MALKQGESKSVISFPENDVRAVEVPLKKMEVRLDDGIISFPNDENEEDIKLEDELNDAMQYMRSMVMALDVDATLENIYSNTQPVQADVHHMEDLPDEIERFKIDPTLDEENIYPKTFQLFLAMYNTSNLPALSNLDNRGSMKNSEELTSTDWKTVISRPGFSYRKERLKIKNVHEDNPLTFRIQSIDAGDTQEEILDSSGSKEKTLDPGKTYTFNVSTPTEFIEVQAKEASSGNPSEAQVVFIGED